MDTVSKILGDETRGPEGTGLINLGADVSLYIKDDLAGAEANVATGALGIGETLKSFENPDSGLEAITTGAEAITTGPEAGLLNNEENFCLGDSSGIGAETEYC